MIDGQLIGAIIGASAAVCAQIVASFIQFMHNRAQLDLAKEQLRLSARQSFIDRKFEAIAHLLENMQALLDNDIDAREAYLKIRHQRFFVDPETYASIEAAIRAHIGKNIAGQGSDPAVSFDRVFQLLNAERHRAMELGNVS